MSDITQRTQEILAEKTTGPSGILPYIVANEVRIETYEADKGTSFQVNVPYYDPESTNPTEIYYGVTRTNRVGVEVAVPPGGTQDIVFKMDGQPGSAELGKAKKQKPFLSKNFSVEAGSDIDRRKLDLLTISTLLSSPNVTDVRLESAFEAAAHETQEEQGWDLEASRDTAFRVDQFNETLFSKRSFDTDPPTSVSQTVFAVGVKDLDGFQASRVDKTEEKITEREGARFYEQGDFLSLRQLKEQLIAAEKQLANDDTLPEIAYIELRAAKSRVAMVEKIERSLHATLASEHGIHVVVQPEGHGTASKPVYSSLDV